MVMKMTKKSADKKIITAPIEDNSVDPNTLTTTRIKKQLSQLNEEAELINADADLYSSPSQQSMHNLTWNLDIPSQTSGKISPIDEQRWIVAIENLLARGVNTHQQISKLTGLNTDLSKKYLIKIKENWSKNLTQGTVNLRRESLYLEHDKIKNFCWTQIDIADPSESKNMLGYIKAIQTSLSSQAKLVGAEVINIDVSNNNVRAMTQMELQQSAAKMLDIDENNLKLLGDMLATAITTPTEYDEVEEEENSEE
jgi:hypothetical protein